MSISVHASTLPHKWLTLRGKNICRRQSESSTERRASGEPTDAVEHAVRPGKVGTVLVRP
ncbi:hypothetical protein OOK58_06170 [Streptomyces sp. NBC_01728]|uniref:hypothetical protein n=1 Tax=unclassified Streptomyces TaxID=2593676 RepID=UPI0022528160|nr:MULTISPECIES: hypothetical protein [unclassified Streptomyces]MCX4462167.1 hypothetical protein [Streptomyces sp. NBC_01719]MCX4491075.1 hypothetical protein [Streptomyces sp. NBC_01728]